MKSRVISGARDLAEYLVDLVDRQEDTFLQLMHADGSLIGIGLKEGQVTHLQCGAAEGREVLPLLGKVKAGDRLLTWPPRPSQDNSQPLSVSELLDALSNGPAMTTRASNGRGREAADSSAGSHGAGNMRLISEISPLLRPHVGPMTDILCAEVMGKTQGPISRGVALEMIDALAANLRDPKAAKEFKTAATARVNALLL
jgi:hypothetical protein